MPSFSTLKSRTQKVVVVALPLTRNVIFFVFIEFIFLFLYLRLLEFFLGCLDFCKNVSFPCFCLLFSVIVLLVFLWFIVKAIFYDYPSLFFSSLFFFLLFFLSYSFFSLSMKFIICMTCD